MPRAHIVRLVALAASVLMSVGAGWLYARYIAADGSSLLDAVRTALFVVTGFWIVWGGLAGLIGVLLPRRPSPVASAAPPVGRTVILMPIYNEDPAASFSRLAAMNRSLVGLGLAEHFHFAILSDTNALEVAAEEASWFEQLLREPESEGRIFYRRRERNIGRKAGNIEDFISRSGGAYDYALILDADSLMDGATIAELARRMDADPRLGLLQTVPQIIHARSLFGRMMQFSAAYLSPWFARGTSRMQGEEGPYWGHNAIVRVKAFAASCGLPVLSGEPPAGGHILSHDYVEAALLSRAGWKVELDPELGGSFEEGPENLIEYAKRDRRWCQGNLQHRRLVAAPGLKFWSRFIFVQGIMAYVASPLWLILLAASILAATLPDRAARGSEAGIWILAVAVAVALLLPKLAILVRGALGRHNREFGGTARAALSVVAELALSTLLAPIMLCFQSRAVFQILFGLDGGWPATSRSESRVGLDAAFAASWWITATGAAVLAVTLAFAPALVPWLVPVTFPAILAPLVIALTSRAPRSGRRPLLFVTPAELEPPAILRERDRILMAWTQQGPLLPDADPVGAAHVHA